MDGISFRAMGNILGRSAGAIFKKITKEMNGLPDNTWLSANYCDRYCGILIIDGKYIKVKGFKQKIPFIYGIDYLTHDIPVGMLCSSESEEAFLKFFRLLKTCRYPLKVAVADGRSTLGMAIKRYYPRAKTQLCQNHYIENIRQILHTRIDQKHQGFFNYIYEQIFGQAKNTMELYRKLHYLLANHAKHDPVRQNIIMDIYRRRKELFQYINIPNCPKDTNLIELYNSHLQARLKSIKGFKSFHAAERWLNAYLIRRRFKPLTDCDKKFKYLNGSRTIERSLKKGAVLPVIYGIAQRVES